MQDQASQQGAKSNPSKFDEAMKANRPDSANATGQVQATQATQSVQATQAMQATASVTQTQAAQRMSATHKVQDVVKAEKTAKDNQTPDIEYEENDGGFLFDPVTQKQEVSKGQSTIMSMLASMEKGQAHMDKLINTSMSGVQFSNQELLQMQAGMYRYTQELELTGKVVEKATSGLKDTLKTQV